MHIYICTFSLDSSTNGLTFGEGIKGDSEQELQRQEEAKSSATQLPVGAKVTPRANPGRRHGGSAAEGGGVRDRSLTTETIGVLGSSS